MTFIKEIDYHTAKLLKTENYKTRKVKPKTISKTELNKRNRTIITILTEHEELSKIIDKIKKKSS